ncbi:MAG: hypothetical protein NT159_19760 [Proteobacteria bacterium]|nr:hypothetical protein [Pseudomonadota bacterium]
MGLISITLLSLALVALVYGLLFWMITSIPLSVLERIQNHGRYSGLGTPEAKVSGKKSSDTSFNLPRGNILAH